jgi:serine/threonine protein phosphatase PrpC
MAQPIPRAPSRTLLAGGRVPQLSSSFAPLKDPSSFLQSRAAEVVQSHVSLCAADSAPEPATPKGGLSAAATFEPAWLRLSGGTLCLHEPGGADATLRERVPIENVLSLRSSVGAARQRAGEGVFPVSGGGGGDGGGGSEAGGGPNEFQLLWAREGAPYSRVLWRVRVETPEQANDWLFQLMRAVAVNLQALKARLVAGRGSGGGGGGARRRAAASPAVAASLATRAPFLPSEGARGVYGSLTTAHGMASSLRLLPRGPASAVAAAGAGAPVPSPPEPPSRASVGDDAASSLSSAAVLAMQAAAEDLEEEEEEGAGSAPMSPQRASGGGSSGGGGGRVASSYSSEQSRSTSPYASGDDARGGGGGCGSGDEGLGFSFGGDSSPLALREAPCARGGGRAAVPAAWPVAPPPDVEALAAAAVAAGAAAAAAAASAAAAPPPAQPAAGRYVPPHLRRSQSSSASDGSLSPSSTGSGSGGLGGRHGSSGAFAACPSPRPAPPAPPPSIPAGAVWEGGSTGAGAGFWGCQGARSSMEDTQVVCEDVMGDAARGALPPLPPAAGAPLPWGGAPAAAAPATRFFAVLDGHGGTLAAHFAAAALPRALLAHAGFASGGAAALAAALREAFLTADAEFLVRANAAGVRGGWASGSTALAAVVRGRDLVVASLGDCRAVLAEAAGGGGAAAGCCAPPACACAFSARALTVEHTPASEAARVAAAGGWVHEDAELSLGKLRSMDVSHPFVARRLAADGASLMRWTNVSRLMGELGVSRALGDADYKGARMGLYPWHWPRGATPRALSADLVIAEPDVVHVALPPLRARGAGAPCCPPFLILACDGLWEVLDSQEAVDVAAAALRGAEAAGGGGAAEGETPAVTAARHLVDIAIRLGTSDNCTALVVLLE